jgi:hypothetical protein
MFFHSVIDVLRSDERNRVKGNIQRHTVTAEETKSAKTKAVSS